MHYVYTKDPISAAAEHISATIKENLSANQKVLWLLSGGSGIQVVLQAAKHLQNIDLTNLSVTLTDERYGPFNHPNENWKQLLDQGFVLPGANLYRPLINTSRTTTTDQFNAWISQKITDADYTIGLFGIGTDGHTAGIKPYSDAANSNTWAESFTGNDFERITITPFTIGQLDEVVIQAAGTDKRATLQQLLHQAVSIPEQPAQILKTITKCTLYTDNEEL